MVDLIAAERERGLARQSARRRRGRRTRRPDRDRRRRRRRDGAHSAACSAMRCALRDELDAIGSEPEPPLHPVLVCQDFTYEGIVSNFRAGEASQGVFTSEGGTVLGGHAMRDETVLRTAAGLSELWDGEPLTVLRSQQAPVILVGRRLTAHWMIQPAIAPRLFKHRIISGVGLTSRILAAAPTSNIGQRDALRREAASTERDLARYSDYLLEILRRPLPVVRANAMSCGRACSNSIRPPIRCGASSPTTLSKAAHPMVNLRPSAR